MKSSKLKYAHGTVVEESAYELAEKLSARSEESIGWRIRRYNPLNLVVEHFEPGGAKNNLGKINRARWVRMGYYSDVEEAAQGMLRHASRLGVSGTRAEDIIQAVESARTTVSQALALLEAKGLLERRVAVS